MTDDIWKSLRVFKKQLAHSSMNNSLITCDDKKYFFNVSSVIKKIYTNNHLKSIIISLEKQNKEMKQ